MKILLTYHSATGNTKKIADYLSTLDYDIDYKEIKDVENVEYDLILVGGWIDKSTYNQETREFIEKLTYKNVGFFFTLGAYPTQAHAYYCIKNIRSLFRENHNNVLNHFYCQGSISDKMRERYMSLPKDHPYYPEEDRIKRWEYAKNHPTEEELHSAKTFVDLCVTKVSKK